MHLRILESVADLRDVAEAWDGLWSRDDLTLPTLRAELAAQWIEQFAPAAPLHIPVVEQDGNLVAALPLMGTAPRWGLSWGALPANCWSSGGDLLLDPAVDTRAACCLLADGLGASPWSVLRLEGVHLERPAWKALCRELDERGWGWAAKPMYPVGIIDIGQDYEAYLECLSGNHRRALRKSRKKLEQQGPVTLHRYQDVSADEAAELVRIVADVEDRSWKGAEGSSIARTGMFDFFVRQAQTLAEWNQLEVLYLEQQGCIFAVSFGYAAKGVFHAHKIGYDPAYAEGSPGRLLVGMQLEQYFAAQDCRWVDTLGICTDANARWSTRTYLTSQLLVGTGGWLGNLAAWGYDEIWPALKGWIQTSGQPPATRPPAAAAFLESAGYAARPRVEAEGVAP